MNSLFSPCLQVFKTAPQHTVSIISQSAGPNLTIIYGDNLCLSWPRENLQMSLTKCEMWPRFVKWGQQTGTNSLQKNLCLRLALKTSDSQVWQR